MGRSELGQVVDREALEAGEGARGRIRIAVPAAWSIEGAEIEITAPARVACARCDGGGCDGCARSGAHRIEGEAAARAVRLRVPGGIAEGGRVALRIARPFGDGAALEQLVVEVERGPAPSQCVALIAQPAPAASRSRAAAAALATLALLAAVAALVANR
ncbi:MAG: hypothetical protein IT372_40020 [Polyangiaceae bacterium]|nr:hypothetical protein [Polyangiaceae bacterium]